MSITALSGLVYVSGVLIWVIKRPNRSTLCLAESNGIEPSSLAQWGGFQDRLSTMLPTLQLLWCRVPPGVLWLVIHRERGHRCHKMINITISPRALSHIHHNGKSIHVSRATTNGNSESRTLKMLLPVVCCVTPSAITWLCLDLLGCVR